MGKSARPETQRGGGRLFVCRESHEKSNPNTFRRWGEVVIVRSVDKLVRDFRDMVMSHIDEIRLCSVHQSVKALCLRSLQRARDCSSYFTRHQTSFG